MLPRALLCIVCEVLKSSNPKLALPVLLLSLARLRIESETQQARHQQLLDLMVPGTTLEPVIYSEIESARVEFEPYKIRAAALERAAAVAGKRQERNRGGDSGV